jgi:hypothetical protein
VSWITLVRVGGVYAGIMDTLTPTRLRKLAQHYRQLAATGIPAERENRLRIADYLERQAAAKGRSEGDTPQASAAGPDPSVTSWFTRARA